MTATPPLFRVLHLSDLHLTADGIDEDGVDARAALVGLLRDLEHVAAAAPLDLVVVSGDVADDGSTAGVRMARELVGGFAARAGAGQAWCVGNHDARTSFTEVLGSGHLDARGAEVAGVERGPRCSAVSDRAGARVITLDSLVPGATPGELGDDQLAWLAEVLSAPAPRGSLVVLHHPPISVSSMPALGGAVLQRPERLAAVLGGSDVRAVLAGHLHLQLAGATAGVPVWVTPGVVTRIDLTAPPSRLRAVLGAGATMVELPADGAPTFHLLHAHDADATTAVYEHPV